MKVVKSKVTGCYMSRWIYTIFQCVIILFALTFYKNFKVYFLEAAIGCTVCELFFKIVTRFHNKSWSSLFFFIRNSNPCHSPWENKELANDSLGAQINNTYTSIKNKVGSSRQKKSIISNSLKLQRRKMKLYLSKSHESV